MKTRTWRRGTAAVLLLAALGLLAQAARADLGSWDTADDPGDTGNLYGVAFGSASNGVAVGNNGKLPMFTTDGGANWQQSQGDLGLPKGSGFHFFSVHFSDPRTAWTVGPVDLPGKIRRNLLIKSTDAGATWSVVPLPNFIAVNGGILYRVWFDNQGNGWISPDNGYRIFRTTDGGTTWQDLKFSPAPLPGFPTGWTHRAFYAFNSQHLWIGGDGGCFFETANGGTTWTPHPSGTAKFIAESIYFADDKNGWAAGDAGMIAHTLDGGVTWQVRDLRIRNTLTAVQFVSDQIGFASGAAFYEGGPFAKALGVLMATEDGGNTWKNVSPTSASLQDVFFLDSRHGWAVGGRGGSGSEPKVMVLLYTP